MFQCLALLTQALPPSHHNFVAFQFLSKFFHACYVPFSRLVKHGTMLLERLHVVMFNDVDNCVFQMHQRGGIFVKFANFTD